MALGPLAGRLAELLRQRAVLHADETPVRQLDPGSGKTHRAYLWAYRGNALDTGPPIVVFDDQTSRSGEHARHFLKDWRGSLMVDDFGGYKALFSAGVVELACLAHARRKFFDLNQAQPNPNISRAGIGGTAGRRSNTGVEAILERSSADAKLYWSADIVWASWAL